jgi:hypothetical protein
MSKVTKLIIGAALVAASSVAGASDLVYNIDFTVGGDAVDGTITTDGSGAPAPSDILAFDLNSSDGVSVSGTASTVFCNTGSCGLVASGNNLAFNFGSTSNNSVVFTQSGSQIALISDEESAPSGGQLATSKDFGFVGDYLSTANVNLGSAPPTSTMMAPEVDPASAASGLTLLFGSLAIFRGRKRRSFAE